MSTTENLQEQKQKHHDRRAPYWAAAMFLFGVAGISTVWIDMGAFWRGYLLDITGPPWNYILFRGLFTSWADNAWTRFFTPTRTFVIFIAVSFGIEAAQYLRFYPATFDPWDLVAYVSLLLPLYLIDLYQTRKDGSG